MKKIILFLIFTSISFFSFEAEPRDGRTEEKRLELVVGIDKDIKFDFAFNTNIQIANSAVLKIARVIPNQRKIILRGTRQGKTSFDVYDKVGDLRLRYIIEVTSNEKSQEVSDLKELIGDVEGIEIGIKGGMVYVGGEIVVPGDIGRVVTVLNKYPDVLRLAEMSPQSQLIISKKIQEELIRNNYRDLNVRVVNKKFWVEGSVASLRRDFDIIKRIVSAYLPDKIESLARKEESVLKPDQADSAVLYFLNENPKKQKPQPPPKQVKVTAQFVELSKSYGKVFAFKWAPILGDNGGSIQLGESSSGEVSTSSRGIFSAIINNLFPKLVSAKEAGYARVIQSGMVITEEKKPGNITKSTQQTFAVGVSEQGTSQAQNSTVGFNMNVTPQTFPGEKVEMAVNLSVSLPGGTDTRGNPITTSNSLSTTVIVKSKESAVIGGVVQNSTNTAYDKNDPDGEGKSDGGVPLFVLLRSKRYVTDKNQYVVFVTPEIIESASSGTEEIRKKFRKRQRY